MSEDDQTDAPTPAEREVTGEPLKFEWAGETFDLPASEDDWDIDIARAAIAGDEIRALELAFGDEFARLEAAHRAANGGRFTLGAVKELIDKYFTAIGLDPGNL